jgi:hypothetical protein
MVLSATAGGCEPHEPLPVWVLLLIFTFTVTVPVPRFCTLNPVST